MTSVRFGLGQTLDVMGLNEGSLHGRLERGKIQPVWTYVLLCVHASDGGLLTSCACAMLALRVSLACAWPSIIDLKPRSTKTRAQELFSGVPAVTTASFDGYIRANTGSLCAVSLALGTPQTTVKLLLVLLRRTALYTTLRAI